MRWWAYVLLGVMWIVGVIVTLVISLEGAKNVVAAELAADPNGLQIATAIVSSIVFAAPGLYLIGTGIRRVRGAP